VLRTRIALFAAALGLMAVLPAHAAVPKLTGKTGPGFTITVKKGTTNVKTVKAGTYVLSVTDQTSEHNFHLVGGGINKKTGVGTTYAKPLTWRVTLKKGVTYRFLCDPHAAVGMKGSFKAI
jgi:plastocyanin